LPACAVKNLSVDILKKKLEKFWCNQDVYYNDKATTTGTKNRSIVK